MLLKEVQTETMALYWELTHSPNDLVSGYLDTLKVCMEDINITKSQEMYEISEVRQRSNLGILIYLKTLMRINGDINPTIYTTLHIMTEGKVFDKF